MSRYDGLEVLENSKDYGGYMQVTNYNYSFSYRIAKAGIVSLERMMLVMDMLTFKHGKELPFTSQDTYAKRFGCSVKVIKEAVKDLKESGLINVIKNGRKNTYDLSPLLKCLASFVEHIDNGVSVCIKKLVKDVLAGEYVPQMVKEEEKPVEPVFDEVITSALDKLSEEDRKAAIPIIVEHGNKMSSESVVFYIELATTKERFEGYFFTCMETGTDESVTKLKEPKSKSQQQKKQFSKKPIRNEPETDWLKKKKEEEEQEHIRKEKFDSTYNTTIQSHYKGLGNGEAYKEQDKFITWYEKELKKFESKEAFNVWCFEQERSKLEQAIGRKFA